MVHTDPTRGEAGANWSRLVLGTLRKQSKLPRPTNAKDFPQETPKRSLNASASNSVEQTEKTGICESGPEEIKHTFHDLKKILLQIWSGRISIIKTPKHENFKS
jgi:hypothetical protein